MAQVVALSWDPQSRVLVCVPVGAGNGGATVSLTVPEESAADVSAQCEGSSLPRVGDLEADDEVCLLELSGPGVRRCSATWRKGSIRLWCRDGGAPAGEVAPDDVGLSDLEVARQVGQIGSFLLFERPVDGVIGCWECEGGLSGWLAQRRARRAEAAADKAARRAQEEVKRAQEEADRRFINPYTFVPFPQSISREPPAGHHMLAQGRLCGTLRVRFALASPMQAPEGAVSGQRLRLPGASVKGALRSLHETLAGGCLRVLDEEFVPSYRDAAAESEGQWTLAVVEEVTRDGQPLTVRLCDRVVWVRSKQLRGAWGDQLATGRRVSFGHRGSFTPPEQPTSLGRYELPDDVPVGRDGNWVVLLSDAGARRATTKRGKPGSYFAACGRVGDDGAVREVAESAWRKFRQAVGGAREVTQRRSGARAGETAAACVPVTFQGTVIGHRKAATGFFDHGDVLWVRHDSPGGVTGLRLAVIWRHAGSGPLGTRVPAHLAACPPRQAEPAAGGQPRDGGAGTAAGPEPGQAAGPEPGQAAGSRRRDAEGLLLCPSCRLFGAADTASRDADETARQRAYAGHVRIGDAVSPGPVELTPFQRAPLGAPRPGAGQFYLRSGSTAAATARTARPTREWGARPDDGSPRPVRGRKFYWHANPDVQEVPRHVAREHQVSSRMSVQRHLAPAGTVLECELSFDNLSEAELGGLLATLRPNEVLGGADGSLRLYLGGGKPLGLGSCRVSLSELRVWSARSRYGDAGPLAAESGRYVQAFVASTPAAVRETWPALKAVLAADTVDPARVWYPPGAYWSEQRDERKRFNKRFDEPFAFFVDTCGMYLASKNKERRLVPLPDPTEPDQSLPIIRKQDLGKGSERER